MNMTFIPLCRMISFQVVRPALVVDIEKMKAKLQNISSFYNCTNHLNHAKPTWDNQMISCRKIWKICGRPTEKENEGVVRCNGAIFNVAMHKVRCSIQAGIVASTIPGSLSCLKILFLCVPCSTSRTDI